MGGFLVGIDLRVKHDVETKRHAAEVGQRGGCGVPPRYSFMLAGTMQS